jgi:hypothetical protein
MREDVLQELEPPTRVAESLESIETLGREAMQYEIQVALAVEGMKNQALLFENAWRRIIMDVAKGQTQAIQLTRPQLLSAFEKRLRLLKETHAIATWLRNLGSENIRDPDVLRAVIDDMERLKADVFDRWQTADDLEDLAARHYPLTTADLDRIGPQRRPPASWYAEESKPF